MTGKILLYVEDDDIQREQVAAILQNAGHSVKLAADGLEALTCLRSARIPNLILLDMMLEPQGFDGWNLLRYIREAPHLASVPVLVVTGLNAATKEWAASIGAAGVLKKPFEPALLLSEVERLCHVENPSASAMNTSILNGCP